MSVLKPAMTATTLIFAMMFGGGVYLFMNMGNVVKNTVENIASDTLGARVSIGSLDISIPEKKAVAKNIRIANPSGFQKPSAVTIQSIDVGLNAISQELIDLKNITVNGTQVFLEVRESSTNLHALKKGIKPKNPDSTSINVRIDRFMMSSATLRPSMVLISNQDLQPIQIPDTVRNNIGQRAEGIPARQAMSEIMKAVIANAHTAAGSAGFLEGLSTDILKEIGITQLNGLTDQITDEINDKINQVGDSLKGLFGN